MLGTVIPPLPQGVTTQILLIVPPHGVQPDTDPAVILIDQLVITAAHQSGTPVVRHILARQEMLLSATPEPCVPTLVTAQVQAYAIGSHTAPTNATAGIADTGIGEQRAVERPA